MATLPTSAQIVSASVTNAQQKTFFTSTWDFMLAMLGSDSAAKAVARANLAVPVQATRIDVASVAGTVDLSATSGSDPSTHDDIRITGALAITKFNLAVGRVVRVVASGAFTLTNNADIVTNTGANIVAAAGDSFMLRATAANVVEVLNYTRATPATTTAATQTEMEAGASSTVFVTPANIKWAPGVAKAWVCATQSAGSYTLAAALGISSLSKIGTGNVENNFSTSMSGTAYATPACCDGGASLALVTRVSVRCTVVILRSSTEVSQDSGYSIAVFGDQ